MEFKDRVSAYPNRYLMTDENGNTSHVVLERDDEPIVPGTPLSAENMNNLLQLMGGTMAGDLNMGGHKITDVAEMYVGHITQDFINRCQIRVFNNATNNSGVEQTFDRTSACLYLIVGRQSLGNFMYMFHVNNLEGTAYHLNKVFGDESASIGITASPGKITLNMASWTYGFIISVDLAHIAG